MKYTLKLHDNQELQPRAAKELLGDYEPED